MKIVFFGTSDVGLPILEALHNSEHEVLQVVTSPDAPFGRKQELLSSPVANLASFLKLPVVKPQSVKNNPEFLEQLRNLQADIFIVVSYGKIMPQELLDIPRLKTLNIHFSLLPKWRGAAPIQYSLLNGEASTGITIFILDAEVDHGPILVQQTFAIEPNDTFGSLAKTLAVESAPILLDLLPKYEAGIITPQEQDHSQATFAKIIEKDQGRIDWSKTAQEIYNQWRAFTPWPGIWTTWQNQNFKILKAQVVESPNEDNLSEVKQCGKDTYLLLQEVQLAGKKAMSMAEFLNGQKTFRSEDLI